MFLSISEEDENRYAELQMIALDFAREGNTQELERMIRYGINVNLCTHKDDSLLMLATYNANLATSKMLLEFGADTDKRNQRGQTPLEGVCFKGNLEMVKLLVENGASMDGNALVYAGIFGHKEIVDYLKKQKLNDKQDKILGMNIEFIVSITAKLKYMLARIGINKNVGVYNETVRNI